MPGVFVAGFAARSSSNAFLPSARWSAWTTPAKNDGPLTNSTSDHQYAQPRTYHVVFEVRSAMQDCNNPYASTTKFEADIIVT